MTEMKPEVKELPEESELLSFIRKRSRDRTWWESARVASRRAPPGPAGKREIEEQIV